MIVSMKIDDVIKKLNEIKATYGNIPVYMSHDSEGNDFATLDQVSFEVINNNCKEYLFIYPEREHLDIEQIVGKISLAKILDGVEVLN